MEINSVRSSLDLLFRNSSGNAKPFKPIEMPAEQAAGNAPAFPLDDSADTSPDFTDITPNALRNEALRSYQNGEIDQDTYATLAEPLPMHAIDARGNILDLTGVTDETSFNFADYYRNQLDVASSIGDPQTAKTLQSVVDYLGA